MKIHWQPAMAHGDKNTCNGHDIGYRRVSTIGQNTTRQLDALELDRVFEDKTSGNQRERPQLNALLAHVRAGDTVHVHSIDRLARNLADLLALVADLTGRGVVIRFHKEALIFDGSDSPMQRMQLQIMGSVAEFERSIINERAAEGRAIARANGVRFGRPSTLSEKDRAGIISARANGRSISAIALDCDVSRRTVSRVLQPADHAG